MKSATPRSQRLAQQIAELSLLQKIFFGFMSATTLASVFMVLLAEVSNGRKLSQAEQAYKSASCEQAIAGYDHILSNRLFAEGSDRKARVAAHKAECEHYLSLVATGDTNPVASAIAHAHDITARYPNSSLGATLQSKASQQFSRTELEQVVTLPLCERVPTLLSQNWLPRLYATGPQLLYLCGQTALSQQQYAYAADSFQTFLSNYPKHELIPAVETGYAEAAIEQAKAAGSGELPPPNPAGYTQTGDTVIAIANDSPDSLRIIFSGPEPRFEELPPCEDCERYDSALAGSCSESSPYEVYRLQPGDYQVLVRSVSDRQVTPFTGEWTLTAGVGYSSCFFISQSAQQPNSHTQPPGVPLERPVPAPAPVPSEPLTSS